MINNVTLVGRITKDPTLNKTNSGTSVVSFTLAVNRKFAKEGEQKADFINCQAWSKTAEFMGNYVKQGALLGVEGRIQTRSYKDAQEKTVYITEVVCDSVQILSQKQGDGEVKPSTNGNGYGSQNSAVESAFGSNTLNIGADDLPF